MNARLEELKRKAQDIRNFLADVYEDPPIGPLLAAYERALADLCQEERRSGRTKIAKRLAASWEAMKSR